MTPVETPPHKDAHSQPSSSNNKNQSKDHKHQSQKRGKRSRKRSIDPEQQYIIEKRDRHSKLVRTSSTILRRECKAIKKIECQRIVRKLKGLHRDENDAIKKKKKTEKKLMMLENRLRFTKTMFDWNDVVEIGLKRIGLVTLDPLYEGRTELRDREDDDGEEDDPVSEEKDEALVSAAKKSLQGSDTTTTSEKGNKKEGSDGERIDEEMQKKFQTEMVESVLQHKKMINVMENLNDKVTEFRCWILQREEQLQEEGQKKKRKKKRGGGSAEDENLSYYGRNKKNETTEDASSHLFVSSLSGIDPYGENSDDNDEGWDGVDEYGQPIMTKKKNRPGQRARKAKAMAKQAKKEGKTWVSSINWREKKNNKKKSKIDDGTSNSKQRRGRRGNNDDDAHAACGLSKNVVVRPSDVVDMGKNWKDEGKAHPSWAARQSLKEKEGSGIVAFQGTKITFD